MINQKLKRMTKRRKKCSNLILLWIILSIGILPAAKASPQPEHLNLFIERSPTDQLLDKYLPVFTQKQHKSTTFEPLKILTDTSGIEHFKSKDINMYNFITAILVPGVVEHIQKTIRVRSPQEVTVSPLQNQCQDYQVPSKYKSVTLNYGLILFFTAEGKPSDMFVAWAGACMLSPQDYRPTMGRINFNPYHLSNERKKLFDQFATIMHEVYHVLGFSSGLYEYYIDAKGVTKKITDTVITNGEGKYKHQIVAPKVVEYAKKFFNCDTLKGVPLEDNGSQGSAGSHWEKTVLGNEFMVANTVANPVISMFTLKLLEETGWYQVNPEMEEELEWGKGQGCAALTGECFIKGATCSRRGQEGCFYDYTFQALCTTDQFQGYCKFYTGTDFNSHDCRAPENARMQTHQNLGEYYGFGSRCFNGLLSNSGEKHSNMCYKAKCDDSGSEITFEVESKEYKCRTKDEKIYPTGMSGYITCPDVKDFCGKLKRSCKDDCSLGGRCLKSGKCYCYPQFSGEVCETYSGPKLKMMPDELLPDEEFRGEVKKKCPADCSGNGFCDDGVCFCKKGYSGSDCAEFSFAGYFGFSGVDVLGIRVWALGMMLTALVLFSG